MNSENPIDYNLLHIPNSNHLPGPHPFGDPTDVCLRPSGSICCGFCQVPLMMVREPTDSVPSGPLLRDAVLRGFGSRRRRCAFRHRGWPPAPAAERMLVRSGAAASSPDGGNRQAPSRASLAARAPFADTPPPHRSPLPDRVPCPTSSASSSPIPAASTPP